MSLAKLALIVTVGLAVSVSFVAGSSNALALDDSEALSESCSDGFEFDGTDGCVSIAPAISLPDSCPIDALGVPGGCYVLVDREDLATCSVGDELVNGLCELVLTYVELGQPADNGTCPAFAPPTATIVNGRCITITTYPPFAPCPVGSLDAAFAQECRVLVDTLTNRQGCADPAAVFGNGECALRTGLVTSAYPGPFDNKPSGPAHGLLDAPDISIQNQNAAIVGSSATPATKLAHTGSETAVAIVALSWISAGFGYLAIGRRLEE